MKKIYIEPKQRNIELGSDVHLLADSNKPGVVPGGSATGTGGANDGTGDQTESRNSLWDAEW